MTRERILICLAAVWIVALIAGSLQPARPGSTLGLHREIHWLAFGGLALFVLTISRNLRQEIACVAAACLLGLSLEFLQHLIYRNAMEWRDVRDDTLAVLIAFAIYRLCDLCGFAPFR
jgi:hypothetical protein